MPDQTTLLSRKIALSTQLLELPEPYITQLEEQLRHWGVQQSPKKPLKRGCMRGSVVKMSDDFDEPLDDFKGYR